MAAETTTKALLIALNYVGGYLGAATTPLAVLVLLAAVLLARPGGLFAPSAARRI